MNEDRLLRDKIFTSRLEQSFLSLYRKLFSIEEIESSVVLHWIYGALLFAYYTTFYRWINDPNITVNAFESSNYRCWSYIPNCGDFYFLNALPYGYSYNALYVALFSLMILGIYLAWKKDWVLAHIVLFILFFWKTLVIFIFSVGANYDYYDFIFSIIFLFLPLKVFFLRFSFVLLYFLASTIKLHDGWILGTYFTSLKDGLPIFNKTLTPLITNFVIFMQIVGSWLLLSGNKVLQRSAVVYFLCFHLYSGILVKYRYLATAIPMLLVLFGPLYSKINPPLSRKAIMGWCLMLILIVMQLIPYMIPGDHRLTLEGNRFGLFMFEANHQCISQTKYFFSDGTNRTYREESSSARKRCDPYSYLLTIQERCGTVSVKFVTWTFDHSINGGPFYRIVNEANACLLDYKTFQHNDWIVLPPNAPIVGYPVENYYY